MWTTTATHTNGLSSATRVKVRAAVLAIAADAGQVDGMMVRCALSANVPCFVHVDDFDLSHNVPASQGGTSNVDNLRVGCRAHNVAQGDRMVRMAYSVRTFSEVLGGVLPTRNERHDYEMDMDFL